MNKDKLKVIENKKKRILEKEEAKNYIRNFEFASSLIQRVYEDDSIIMQLFYLLDKVMRKRLARHYENCILKEEKIPYSKIIKRNSKYLKSISEEIKNMGKDNLTSFAEAFVIEIENYIDKNEQNIIYVPFYDSYNYDELIY